MKKYNIWRTKEGLVLRIEDMSDEHIKNCIKGILQTAIAQSQNRQGMFTSYFMQNFGKRYLIVFWLELKRRGIKKLV